MGRMSESIERLRSNERQWQAFKAEGHCIVLAPPGSGKTEGEWPGICFTASLCRAEWPA